MKLDEQVNNGSLRQASALLTTGGENTRSNRRGTPANESDQSLGSLQEKWGGGLKCGRQGSVFFELRES